MNNIFCIFPNLKNYSGHEFSFTPSLNALAKKITPIKIYANFLPINAVSGSSFTLIYQNNYFMKIALILK